MKRALFAMAAIGLLVLMLGAGPAFADHKQGHRQPPACEQGAKSPNQNKHCYPPGPSQSQQSGSPASFSTPAEAGGMTVGTASAVALGSLGLLLAGRRVWAFRTK